MNKNKKLIERIGIDKTIVCNADIQFNNLNAIRNLENVSIVEMADSPIQSLDGIGIARFKLTDRFGALQVGLCKNEPYQRIEINISDDGDNLQNLTTQGYKDRLKKVFKYIEDNYSITIKQDNLLLKGIEVNGTFEIEGKFAEYRRAIMLLMQNLPVKKYTDKNGHNLKFACWYQVVNDCVYVQTFYAANTRIEFKVYAKTQQLKDVHNCNYEKEYIRIEYKLKKADSVCSALDGNAVADLTDEKIKKFFLDRFQEDIVTPYTQWKAKNKTELKAIVSEHMQKNPYRWYYDFIRHIRQYEAKHITPLLFDLEDVKPILKELDNGKRNWKRKWDKINDDLSNEYESDLKGNNQKIIEIIEKIQQMA